MRAVELDRSEWEPCFATLGRESMLVAVGLSGRARSDDVELWRPLRDARYDAGQDLLVLDVGGGSAGHSLRFFVAAPRRITIADDGAASVLVVADATGTETVVRLTAAGLAGRVGSALDSTPPEWAAVST